ncbi:phosphotransferase [Nocardiopsis lambiniae]|uniref:Phosphotransferase n=1 Tax=Nocardiopsis lambiniae TaxID=3075539 RepID=A0ABU2M495_9ACTN|nr:phosphotransferase [Nocardiopsis sp. DSM 44743]MDT0326975.1 phosphotransferase [Nocardiopsis sp. DSM 44743]
MASSNPFPDLTGPWHRAARELTATPDSGGRLRAGMGGRTLGGPVMVQGIQGWLRVMAAPRAGGKIWEGANLADVLLPEEVPRPALLGDLSWSDENGLVFQAHLWERLYGEALSPTPNLDIPILVTDQWWNDLLTALDHLHRIPAPIGRQVMTQDYINRIPRFIPALHGRDLTVERWETSHGDLHWANLTTDPLQIIDWEGWGSAPAGYDAAVLHAYALNEPATAARVREVFADVLDTPGGRLAQWVICAEIIQAADRDRVHARLQPHIKLLAEKLLVP